MDSINANQEENPFRNLDSLAALKKVKQLAEGAETCFFCTNIKTGLPFSVRPMSIQEVDEEGNMWFMSANDSHKNDEISHDPFVHLLFQESKHAGFLNIYGIAEVSTDRARVDKYWNPLLKVWFTEGKDDPRITFIKVVPSKGYYWDTKHGAVIAFMKMAAAVVTGRTMDDSEEGTLEI